MYLNMLLDATSIFISLTVFTYCTLLAYCGTGMPLFNPSSILVDLEGFVREFNVITFEENVVVIGVKSSCQVQDDEGGRKTANTIQC